MKYNLTTYDMGVAPSHKKALVKISFFTKIKYFIVKILRRIKNG